MAQAQRVEAETEVKCSAQKIYGLFKNNITQLVKYFPQFYKSIQVLEGDGKSVNSVVLFKFVLPGISPSVMVAKSKIKVVNNQNRSITTNIMDGDLMSLYKSFDVKMTATPRDDGCSCSVKWCLEFEKYNKDVPNPDVFLDTLSRITKDLGRHL